MSFFKKLFFVCLEKTEENEPEITSERNNQNKETNIEFKDSDNNIDIDIDNDDILLEGNNLKIENESGNLFNENIIIINERGLENKSNKNIGITKFGPKNKESINDCILNCNDYIETLFSIIFNKNTKKYSIYSEILSNEFIEYNLFIKVTKKLKIDKNYYISFGEIHLTINRFNNEENIEIIIVYENNEKKSYNYEKSKQSVITIGREKNCDIPLTGLNYSRVQCKIFFDDNEYCWFFCDGDGIKESSNGCWIFLNFDWEINEDIKLRSGLNTFNIKLENNKMQ